MPPSPGKAESVRVAVRCRPRSEREGGQREVVEVNAAAGQVTLAGGGGDAPRTFTFDRAFGPESSQAEVYEALGAPLVASMLAGYNATLFAFGQTGTGKTHTMEGASVACGTDGELPPSAGMIPRAFRQIFQAIGASRDQTFLVRASMLEIYNEEIRDLLSKSPEARLELHEARDGGVYAKGLKTFVVKSEAEIAAVLEAGKRNRSVGATLMNQDSSRSHSVFTITVEAADVPAAGAGPGDAGGGSSGGSSGGGGSIRVGRLNLVDLAGSERQAKTQAAGDRLREACNINLSLSALGNVISALVDGRSGHVPYRDSKLTRLLQESLGGNALTVMIANVGPAASNAEETLSTLRYANRAKNIKNKPRVNEDPKDAMLREFQQEIARLKAELEAAAGDGGDVDSPSSSTAWGGPGGAPAEAGETGLDPKEVARMRQQLEEELRAEYSNGSGELDAAALEKVKQEVEVQLAEQVKQVHAEQQRAAREAARLEQQLRQQSAQVQQVAARKGQDAAHNAELAAKLKLLEGKLLHGEQAGGLDRLAKQAAAQLSRQQAELRKQQAAEAEAKQRIASLESTSQAVQAHTQALQDQAAEVTARLQAAVADYEAAQAELGDVYGQWERDREDLVNQIRALHHNLALKALVIDAFIPQEEVAKLMRRMASGENASPGAPESPSRRPASAAPRAGSAARRPSASSVLQLVQLELDVPARCSVDYSSLEAMSGALCMGL